MPVFRVAEIDSANLKAAKVVPFTQRDEATQHSCFEPAVQKTFSSIQCVERQAMNDPPG